MKFLNRILGSRSEQRTQDPSWAALEANLPTGAGSAARLAENLATVLACVNRISGSLASLPAFIYRGAGIERVEDPNHAVAQLVRRGPNAHQSWPDFVEWLAASALLRGNGLAEIVSDPAGSVTALRPIPWEWVAVQVLPSGRLAYDVTEMTSLYGGPSRSRRLLEGEVLHLRDRTDDGLVGRSRLARAASTMRAAFAIQDYTTDVYANGMYPSGILMHPSALKPEAIRNLRTGLKETLAGAGKHKEIAVLEEGTKYQAVSLSPEDAELLAARRFTAEELARIFDVPPPLVGDLSHGTFTNSETAGRWFASHTLAPWIRKIESEFGRSVFGPDSGYSLVLDLSGLMRGDPEARWRSHEIAVRNRILTPNEVRGEEGWNPRDGGDDFPAGSATPNQGEPI